MRLADGPTKALACYSCCCKLDVEAFSDLYSIRSVCLLSVPSSLGQRSRFAEAFWVIAAILNVSVSSLLLSFCCVFPLPQAKSDRASTEERKGSRQNAYHIGSHSYINEFRMFKTIESPWRVLGRYDLTCVEGLKN